MHSVLSPASRATPVRRTAPLRCSSCPRRLVSATEPSIELGSVPARLVALFIALALLWFVNLDARRLVHPDEGRYAEIAREMVATGDWVTPRLNGLKYFEKPPLQYWVTAVAYGHSASTSGRRGCGRRSPDFSACLRIGYAGYALGGATLGAYRRPRARRERSGTSASRRSSRWTPGSRSFSRSDSPRFVIAQRAARRRASARRTWMWVAWAAMAGATLSKGLIGIVLPGGALVVYTALTRDFAVWRRLHLVSGLALYLALTAPWFVAVARANDEFLQFFFIHEHFERFLTTEHDRAGAW